MTTSAQLKLGECIGEGAYGEVYELIGHEPPAVIKYIACKNGKARQMFKNECKALKAIDHANVVRILSTKENGKKLGIVMEYCQKGPLKGVILGPKITYSMNTALTWGIQLFDAIDHIYQKGKLVHRDIKPDNIFVTSEYQLKIGDFGLVKVVGDGTAKGTWVGTPRYMSPPDMKEDGVQREVYEQIKVADVSNSHRNDVYSLGLVMWEIIERRTIFTNYERSGVFARDLFLFDIALQRVTEIESPDCQSEIQKIILKCTNFQRIHRPPASEVLDLLKTHEANQFISSLPFTPTEDENQNGLMKPIGFDDRTEGVMVESEERKYIKRLDGASIWQNPYMGSGAMGQAHELIGHEPPAVIKYMLCGNDARLEIFKNECKALMKIHHENVVRLYRYIEEEKRVGIIMEYCQKGPLKGVILDPTMTYSMNTVLTWGIQLFDAIDHMYQKHQLVHRDIKPDNIFVTNEYQLKIGDFGLVKVVGDGTVTGTFIGTQRYMSPPNVQRDVYEQIKESDVLDSHRNDVYSLGLVMWEIIERRTIFTNYGMLGEFDRDQLLYDIALKRVTEIESPDCQSEIQKIILRCTNFQRIHRPPASGVLDFLQQTNKANQFISSLPFMPTEDENQKELMKPIGFDDRKGWVVVESEERKYEKRFEEGRGWLFKNNPRIMREKLGTLNSIERNHFYKEAPNIVARLKEEIQTFKDARYVIKEILRIEKKKENLHEKNIYEIFELFVLRDFQKQRWEENRAFVWLKSHEENWISSFYNWEWCANWIHWLKEMKTEKYTTNFYFRCFISQLTGEGWIHIEKDKFVSEDLRLWKEIPGRWVDNPRAEIKSYKIENEDKKHEMLHFSHYRQIPLERIIEAFPKQQQRMETIIKLHLKHLIPIEDSEKNNVSFNIESILDKFSESKRSSDTESTSESDEESETSYGPHPKRSKRSSNTKSCYGSTTYPFPHYIFQLKNPPRSICQKNHSGKCRKDGLRKMKRWSDFPKELHIPVCGEITENEVLFLDNYMVFIRFDRDLTFHFVKHPFLFLCCQNLLDIPFLILLDHPNNYENGERILGFDLKMKLHHIDVGVLGEYFQESKLNERVYALIKVEGWIDYDRQWPRYIRKNQEYNPFIRLIDYQGNPKTEWLEFKKVAESGFLLTDHRRFWT